MGRMLLQSANNIKKPSVYIFKKRDQQIDYSGLSII